MTKAIRSYPKAEQKAVIARRIAGKTGGLGYIAAVQAEARNKSAEKAKTIVEEVQANQVGKPD